MVRPELLVLLAQERDRMDDRMTCLRRHRAAIAGYLDAVRDATAGHDPVPMGSRFTNRMANARISRDLGAGRAVNNVSLRCNAWTLEAA